MGNDALVSVIVPVYNVVDYLHRTIDSLLAQTYCNFELLLVDDGSTDGSGEICDSYEKEDCRVKVFHKQNGGVSSARNCGLNNAVGEYVCFVDSDDWVKEDYIRDLVSDMHDDVDFVMSDFMYTSGSYEYIPLAKDAKVGTVEILFPNRGMLRTCYSPYGKLFRRRLIIDNLIKYDTAIHNGEDRFFLFTYLLYVNKVAFSPAVNYCYCRRPGSLISKLYDFEREYYPYEKSLELVKCLVEKKGITDAAIVANLNTMVCDFANRAINAIYHSSDFRYAMRMKLLKRIDLRFLGRYMYAGNFKEKITKWLIACRLYWLYDMFRTLRRKI